MRETRPSATALLIAQAMVFQARVPELSGLIPPDAAEEWDRFLAVADPGRARLVRRVAGEGWAQALATLGERAVIPGVRLHYVVRKRYLEDAARRALGEGASQMVVLGAGLDPLALRLHRELPRALFIECDHPATQRVKRRVLQGTEIGPNLRLIELDLAKAGLPDVLPGLPGWRREADTLLIAEGLTMYLQAREVDALFAFLREHAGPGSRFAFTFMEPQRNGAIDFPGSTPLVRPWLRMVGEPFTWGIRREDLPGFLAARSFTLLEMAGADLLRQRYLAPAGLADRRLAAGEYLAVA
ncbi:MAG TPA: SAM-dependent methyltransferase, partial [Thermoanaerobaculia bacterium]|nr:SAM-dependent methyltransferase [Thermoanaerobaculia bacterium]